jgi:hypothetical protein
MAIARKTNGKKQAPAAPQQPPAQGAALRIGDRFLTFYDEDLYAGSTVGYMTVIDGPNERGEYRFQDRATPQYTDEWFVPSYPLAVLDKRQWKIIEAAGFPKTTAGLLAALGGVTLLSEGNGVAEGVNSGLPEENRGTPERDKNGLPPWSVLIHRMVACGPEGFARSYELRQCIEKVLGFKIVDEARRLQEISQIPQLGRHEGCPG